MFTTFLEEVLLCLFPFLENFWYFFVCNIHASNFGSGSFSSVKTPESGW